MEKENTANQRTISKKFNSKTNKIYSKCQKTNE